MNMALYTSFCFLIVLAALLAYINHKFIKLPSTIGLMLLALLVSLVLLGVGILDPGLLADITSYLRSFNFPSLLLRSMLSFMLFAGAIHIRTEDLKKEGLPIILFSTIGVVISTFFIGTVFYYLLPLFSLPTPYIYCLLFGALISPTDPIAVIAILKAARIPKSLEVRIAGESLFNDGVGVVVFLTILQVAGSPVSFQPMDVVILFVREAIGGLIFGLALGYAGLLLIKGIDDYKVEILITLAIVMGGYALAEVIGVSGPLAMVAAGILIGNQGKKYVMSETTIDYLDKFWELIDETLNSILFVLIGLELLIIHFNPENIIVCALAVPIVLVARYISVFLPAQIIRLQELISQKSLMILTWGGLRGGISIALALSLRHDMQKDLWEACTYSVVAISILVQGLTIGKLARRFTGKASILHNNSKTIQER